MNKDLENHIHETTREVLKLILPVSDTGKMRESDRLAIIERVTEVAANIAVSVHTKTQHMIGAQDAKQLSVDDMVVAKDVNRYGVVKEITATSVTVAFDGVVPDREYQISEMHLIKPLGMRNPDGV